MTEPPSPDLMVLRLEASLRWIEYHEAEAAYQVVCARADLIALGDVPIDCVSEACRFADTAYRAAEEAEERYHEARRVLSR